MNIFKPIVLFSLFGLIASPLKADIPKDLLKKILKATANFETYSIDYSHHFKYPNEADTVKESYHSLISRTEMDMYVGYHQISYQKSGQVKSLAAANNTEVARLNYKDKYFYVQTYKDNPSKFVNNLNSYLYQPLLYSKDELNQFKFSLEDDNKILLDKVDTTKDQKNRVTLITYTTLTISKKDYLPVKEVVKAIRNGKTQYASYELINYNLLNANRYADILKQSDSFLLVIKQNTNGDSLKTNKKDLYKKIKIGDTVANFSGSLNSGSAFNFNTFKDSIVILDFFYTTCVPCIAAIPELNNVYNNYRGKGVMVIGVNPFDTDWENIPNFINDRTVNYPIVKTTKQTVYDYGVTGYPRLFVVKNGIIVKIYYGFAKGLDKELIKLIDSIK